MGARGGGAARARLYQATADDFQRNIKSWTVTTTGPDAPQYYIRLSKTGDPNAAISYGLGNGGPTLDQRAVIDQGFLEMVRLGLKPASDPTIVQSLPVGAATTKTDTSTAPRFHPYNADGHAHA